MIFKRRNPENKNIGFSYPIEPHKIPNEIWQFARSQNSLWNELVDLHDALLESIKDKILTKEEKKDIYTQFQKECASLASLRSDEGLGCYCAAAILNSFKKTLEEFYKKRTTGGIKRGKPTKELSVRHINIVHTSRNGGFPLRDLFNPKVLKNVTLEPTNRKNWLLGKFLIDGKTFEFGLIYTRPLPPASLIKHIHLIGNHTNGYGWSWKLVLVLEVPPNDSSVCFPLEKTGRTGALDIGWRDCGDYFRIGVLTDDSGISYELRWPKVEDDQKRRLLRQHLKTSNAGYTIPEISLNSLREQSSQQDEVLEYYKVELKKLFPQMDSAYRPDAGSWHLVRQGRLKLLIQQMEDWQRVNGSKIQWIEFLEKNLPSLHRFSSRFSSSAHWLVLLEKINRALQHSISTYVCTESEMKGALELWEKETGEKIRSAGTILQLIRTMDGQPSLAPAVGLELLRKWAVQDFRFIRNINRIYLNHERLKRYIFWNLSRWLATHFDTIYYEGNLSLKEMAEESDQDYAIENAQKHRQWFGLSDLVSKMKWAFEKYRKNLIGVACEYTTQECNQCGSLIKTGAKMILTCANGHKVDQDQNATGIIYTRGSEKKLPPMHREILPIWLHKLQPQDGLPQHSKSKTTIGGD